MANGWYGNEKLKHETDGRSMCVAYGMSSSCSTSREEEEGEKEEEEPAAALLSMYGGHGWYVMAGCLDNIWRKNHHRR